MSAKIVIPAPLRQFVHDAAEIAVEGTTVGDVMLELTEKNPALRHHLFSDDGKIRGFENVFVNSDDICFLQGTATPVRAGGVVSIIPSIAGG